MCPSALETPESALELKGKELYKSGAVKIIFLLYNTNYKKEAGYFRIIMVDGWVGSN